MFLPRNSFKLTLIAKTHVFCQKSSNPANLSLPTLAVYYIAQPNLSPGLGCLTSCRLGFRIKHNATPDDCSSSANHENTTNLDISANQDDLINHDNFSDHDENSDDHAHYSFYIPTGVFTKTATQIWRCYRWEWVPTGQTIKRTLWSSPHISHLNRFLSLHCLICLSSCDFAHQSSGSSPSYSLYLYLRRCGFCGITCRGMRIEICHQCHRFHLEFCRFLVELRLPLDKNESMIVIRKRLFNKDKLVFGENLKSLKKNLAEALVFLVKCSRSAIQLSSRSC